MKRAVLAVMMVLAVCTPSFAFFFDPVSTILDAASQAAVEEANFLHCQQASLAAQAGKHIYCEKPLANNSNETKLMTQEALKANIINQVAFVMRFNPAVAAAHAAIKQGVIGRPYASAGSYSIPVT